MLNYSVAELRFYSVKSDFTPNSNSFYHHFTLFLHPFIVILQSSYVNLHVFYDKESIFSIGFTASFAIFSSTSTVGQPYFKAL